MNLSLAVHLEQVPRLTGMLRAQHAQAGTDTPQASQYMQRRRLLHLKQQEHSKTCQVSQSTPELQVLQALTTWHGSVRLPAPACQRLMLQKSSWPGLWQEHSDHAGGMI